MPEYRDVWSIGVITYFLLCGYTPFDRDSNLEEMQAILKADYKFEPADYWQDVSENGNHHQPSQLVFEWFFKKVV